MKFSKRLLRFLNRRLAAAGPYRFCDGPWKYSSDINVLTDAIQTETFRKQISLVSLELADFNRYCVIAPHQDDEVIGSGGTIRLATNQGAQAKVIYIYDGAEIYDKWTPEEIVAMRHKEAKAACGIMGASLAELGISNISPSPTAEDVDRIISLLQEFKPEIILTPWLFDSPPKHRLTNYLVYVALTLMRDFDCEVWGYQVHNTPFANSYVDITSVAEEKRRMLQCFTSQLETRCRHDHITMGMNAWNGRFLPLQTLRPEETYFEIFLTLPKVDYLRQVETYYQRDPQATYGGQGKIIEAAETLRQILVNRT